MPFQIIRQDITRLHVDVIVNAARPSLLGGGGVDGAIHRAAGPDLLAECRTLGGCETGQAKITGAYRLPCRYVIHTVGPVWRGGSFGEAEALAACYRNSLALAAEHGCGSAAFPLISAGAYGYPRNEAIRIALREIESFLADHEMAVTLVVFDRESAAAVRARDPELTAYIDDNYVDARREPPSSMRRRAKAGLFEQKRREQSSVDESALEENMFGSAMAGAAAPLFAPACIDAAPPLDALVEDLDESFQQMLLRKIDESGMTDAQCYKKANIDRKLFSKIRKDVHYRPSKPTAVAFAVALGLSLDETRSLLEKAGYALSRSSKFDVIVRYFIERGEYDIYRINEALFTYDQSLLGA